MHQGSSKYRKLGSSGIIRSSCSPDIYSQEIKLGSQKGNCTFVLIIITVHSIIHNRQEKEIA